MNTEILLADDHQIVRDGLKSLIEKQPSMRVVGETGNGRDVVAAGRRGPPPPPTKRSKPTCRPGARPPARNFWEWRRPPASTTHL